MKSKIDAAIAAPRSQGHIVRPYNREGQFWVRAWRQDARFTSRNGRPLRPRLYTPGIGRPVRTTTKGRSE